MDENTIVDKIERHKASIKKLQSELVKKEKSTYPPKIYDQVHKDSWSMYWGDCVKITNGLEDNSIHYSIFSPPFLSLYVYSDNPQDMGNSKTDDKFYTHFSYLIPELLRVIKPGRLVTVHCSLVPMTMQHEGVIGLKDLPGQITRLFQQYGFIYHSKVNVWKDPLLQATRTKMLTLAHKQISKDSTRCAQGFADELLTFRKPGDNPESVKHGRGFEYYIGEQQEPKQSKQDDPRKNKYSHEVWQRYASPVWWDINQSLTLNIAEARDNKDERHICPLQLPVISRCLELWTNEGDTVFSPFAGIGSEGYEALKMNRKFIGIELKESYYETAIRNLNKVLKRPKKLIR